MGKSTKTLRLDDGTLSKLEHCAVDENRSLNNLVETVLRIYTNHPVPLDGVQHLRIVDITATEANHTAATAVRIIKNL